MIQDLNEINRLLLAFDQYKINNSIKREKLLEVLRNSPVISQSLLDHQQTLEFCKVVELIKETKDRITLTAKGLIMMKFLKKNNPAMNYDITQEQCEFLNSQVFLTDAFPSPIRQVLHDYFAADDEKETWSYDYYENRSLPEYFMEYMPILKQSALIIDHDGIFEINKKYAPQISTLIANKRTLPPERLKEMLAEHGEVGEIAEEKVLQYEKEELSKANCVEEAHLVKHVSKWDVAAGFDIKSFSGPSRTKRHDKFIEVKGSKGREFRFYWSSNEIETAHELQDKYWLYFLPDVYNTKTIEPIKFQNPVKSILSSGKFTANCIGYQITYKL